MGVIWPQSSHCLTLSIGVLPQPWALSNQILAAAVTEDELGLNAVPSIQPLPCFCPFTDCLQH